jgi:hypothetical protein
MDGPLTSNLCFLYAQCPTKSKRFPIDGPLTIQLIFFTCAALHTKRQGLLIDSLLTIYLYILYTQRRIKKQGAPD